MSDSFLVKLLLSLAIVVLAVPGLIIEPGPFSEMAALAGLGAIWGFDLLDDGGGS